MNYFHSPVLLEEVVKFLFDSKVKYFLDCTLGEGGHSEEILRRFPEVTVYGIDRDSDILKIAGNRLSIFQNRINLINLNFNEISPETLMTENGFFDCALIDLGISMFHYKKSEKGFSFMHKEKLDMRLDDSETSAFDIVNDYSEKELSDIFFTYGEERFSRRIASKIIYARKEKPIEYSDELALIIKNAIPAKFRSFKIHPATKCFQALRIYINNEIDNIKTGLPRVLSMIKSGGKLGVITFHSIEDRTVKRIFSDMALMCDCPPGLPICVCKRKAQVTRPAKAVKPSDEEIENNPASRSSKLRVVCKI